MMTQQSNLATDYLPIEPRAGRSGELPGFSLSDFVCFVRVRQKIILGTALVVVALITAIVFQMTPEYSATSVVMIDQRKNNVEDSGAVLSALPMMDPATVLNQVQVLTSIELAGKVIDKLKLDQDPEFTQRSAFAAFLHYLNPLHWAWWTKPDTDAKQSARTALIQTFLRKLTVSPIGLSTVMNVTFQSKDPKKAARIANAVSEAYVQYQLNMKFDANQKATQWLSGRIAELSRNAQAADAAVQQYKAAHNISVNVTGVSVVEQQIADINTQLIVAKGTLAQKQAEYGRLLALAKSGRAASAPQVLASTLISTLRAQQSALTQQIAELSSKYGPRHPKMRDLQAQKENLEAGIDLEVQRIIESMRSDVETAQAHVASLENSLKEFEARGAGQNEASVKLTALQSAATSTRTMYEAFLSRLNQTQDQQGIQTPDARIISNALVPQYPSSPKKAMAVGASIPAGLMLGLFLAFIAERVDAGFRTTSQVEAALGLPVLSTIPEMTAPDKSQVRVTELMVDKPVSSYAEAIRELHLGITAGSIDKPPKVILVTSSAPGEGKTSVSISLARMAARTGARSVIVDADLRHPRVAEILGTKHDRGLVEALNQTHSIEHYLVDDPRSPAKVLACLQSPDCPADVLSTKSILSVIDQLRERFDLVIVDTAPILPVTDARILSRAADAVLFVVRWEKTPREAAVQALRTLADVRAPVIGVALTRADFARYRYYNYGFQDYTSYSKYYGE